jgi:hypothetical protein
MSAIILLFYALTHFVPSQKNMECSQCRLSISGTIYYTVLSLGGIERDNGHLTPIPLAKYTMYVVRFNSVDSLPIVVDSFKTSKTGCFNVALLPGKYGFITAEEAKNKLLKGQFLPKKIETYVAENRFTSEWECSVACPLELGSDDIKNIVITNHRSYFCMNCQ